MPDFYLFFLFLFIYFFSCAGFFVFTLFFLPDFFFFLVPDLLFFWLAFLGGAGPNTPSYVKTIQEDFFFSVSEPLYFSKKCFHFHKNVLFKNKIISTHSCLIKILLNDFFN